MEKFFDNLPERNINHVKNDMGRNAFKELFADPYFIIREEFENDYGVDFVIEALSNNGQTPTNMRAQVQLKSSDKDKNVDGSYSYIVKSTNLNYLLNYSSSFYVLYSLKEDKFYYKYAEEVQKEYVGKNLNFNNQNTITIRFEKYIDENEIKLINNKILEDGLNNRVLREKNFSNLKLDIGRIIEPKDVIYPKEYIKSTKQLHITYNEYEEVKILVELYNRGEDLLIHEYADKYEEIFPNKYNILNILYLSEVNLAMDGLSNISIKRINEAIKLWKELLDMDYQYKDILYFNIGNAYLALNNVDISIKMYLKCLKLNEKNAQCYKNLGSCYLEKGKKKFAKETFEKAIKYDPTLFEALFELAMYEKNQDNYEGTLNYLNKISLSQLFDKNKKLILYWKAYAYWKLKKIEQGISVIEDILNIDSEYVCAWILGSYMYIEICDNSEAWLHKSIDFFERYVRENSGKAELYAQLGFLYWKNKNNLEDTNVMLNYFKEALKLGYDDNGLIWDRIGHIYQEKKDYTNAKKYFKEATLRNRKEFGYCYGICLKLLDKCDEAALYLKEAAEKYQPDQLSYYNLGGCYVRIMKHEEAEKCFKKAIEIDENYENAWFDLGGLYWNNKKYTKAREIWKEAIRKFPYSELVNKVKEFLSNI